MRQCKILKYVSFLMILSALVRLFFGLGMINFFATARSMGYESAALSYVLPAFGLILLCAVCELICGFSGALNWEEPLRVGRCLLWGCAALALGIAGNAMQRLTGYGVSIIAWCTGVILPVLFCLAAGWFFHRSRPIRRP